MIRTRCFDLTRNLDDDCVDVSYDRHGPLVAAFGRAVGTYNGRRGLIPENRIEMPAAWKALVQEGQIQTWQVYADWTEGTGIMERDSKKAQE